MFFREVRSRGYRSRFLILDFLSRRGACFGFCFRDPSFALSAGRLPDGSVVIPDTAALGDPSFKK